MLLIALHTCDHKFASVGNDVPKFSTLRLIEFILSIISLVRVDEETDNKCICVMIVNYLVYKSNAI